jgi:ATP-binding cassette subfamily B protein
MFNKILKYAGKYKVLTALATFMVIVAVAAQILPYMFVSQLIAPLIAGDTLAVDFIVQQVLWIFVCLMVNVLFYLGGLSFSHISAFNTLFNLRAAIQKKTEALPLGVIHDMGTGRLKKLFVDDVESMELLLAHAIPEGIGNTFVPIGVFIAMFVIDWKLALLTLAVLPLGLVCIVIMMRQGFSKMEKYYTSAQVMNNTIIEYVNGMEVVKIFNKDGDSYKRYRKDVLAYRDFTLGWYKVSWPWMALYGGIFACAALFTLPFGAQFVINGTTSLADLILVLCLTFSVGGPILKALRFVPTMAQIARKVDEIEKTVDAKPLKSNNNAFSGDGNSVVYENVTFAYKKTDVIKNVGITAKPGEKTAFVGESGSGKSTLAKLLVHFYDVNGGRITLGGQDITDMSLKELNNRVSFVSQEQFLFNTSIYDNIRVGNPAANEAEVLEAARKAQCDEFTSRLENGIHTLAGDCGNQLSGGERQRVALARAILKNAPVVVLDEATAFADPENEEKMEIAINEVVKDKTLIVIAHRLTSVMDADRIYVLDKGEVSAFGTHAQLLESSPLYQRLWQASERSAEWKVAGAKEGN